MSDFEKHYSELFDYVYRYVFIRLQNKAITEDLVSSIFLSALEKQHQYDAQRGSWRQWITGIARNAIFTHWKKQKPQMQFNELMFETVPASSDVSDTLWQFQTMLKSLSDEFRLLFIMRYEEDLTYEQIAAEIGKKPAAVRKIFSRLHQELRVKFPHLKTNHHS